MAGKKGKEQVIQFEPGHYYEFALQFYRKAIKDGENILMFSVKPLFLHPAFFRHEQESREDFTPVRRQYYEAARQAHRSVWTACIWHLPRYMSAIRREPFSRQEERFQTIREDAHEAIGRGDLRVLLLATCQQTGLLAPCVWLATRTQQLVCWYTPNDTQLLAGEYKFSPGGLGEFEARMAVLQRCSLVPIFDSAARELQPWLCDESIARAMADEAAVRLNDPTVLNSGFQAPSGADLLLGHSQAARKVEHMIDTVADTPLNVLLTGETGTGKSLVAREIHRRSPRANGPFQVLPCGTVSETMLHSALFGHVRGAFTGALSDGIGHFAQADGGTLVLEEIDAMPLGMQSALLRVLETGRFTPLGETKERPTDVRVIAATTKRVSDLVKEGKLRIDLYARLNQYHCDELPPLRNRKRDIPDLVCYFRAKWMAKYVGSHSSWTVSDVAEFPNDVVEMLKEYDWPCNMHELWSAVGQALARAKSRRSAVVTVEDLPPEVQEALKQTSASGMAVFTERRSTCKEAIEEIHDLTGWLYKEIAKRAGLSPSCVSKLIHSGTRKPSPENEDKLAQLLASVKKGDL